MAIGIENAGYNAFFEALLEGRLRLGQTLTQEQMAVVLGLSLSPMRETTTLLEAEGMITIRRKVGITIFYPDFKFVGNTFQLRGLLEREGLRKFSRMVTKPWIEAQRAAHHEIIGVVRAASDQAIYRDRMRAHERQFHETFIDVYENDQVSTIYARLTQKMYIIRLHNMEAVGPAASVLSMQEHLAIIDALAERNTDAAVEALERHLQKVLHRVMTT